MKKRLAALAALSLSALTSLASALPIAAASAAASEPVRHSSHHGGHRHHHLSQRASLRQGHNRELAKQASLVKVAGLKEAEAKEGRRAAAEAVGASPAPPEVTSGPSPAPAWGPSPSPGPAAEGHVPGGLVPGGLAPEDPAKAAVMAAAMAAAQAGENVASAAASAAAASGKEIGCISLEFELRNINYLALDQPIAFSPLLPVPSLVQVDSTRKVTLHPEDDLMEHFTVNQEMELDKNGGQANTNGEAIEYAIIMTVRKLMAVEFGLPNDTVVTNTHKKTGVYIPDVVRNKTSVETSYEGHDPNTTGHHHSHAHDSPVPVVDEAVNSITKTLDDVVLLQGGEPSPSPALAASPSPSPASAGEDDDGDGSHSEVSGHAGGEKKEMPPPRSLPLISVKFLPGHRVALHQQETKFLQLAGGSRLGARTRRQGKRQLDLGRSTPAGNGHEDPSGPFGITTMVHINIVDRPGTNYDRLPQIEEAIRKRVLDGTLQAALSAAIELAVEIEPWIGVIQEEKQWIKPYNVNACAAHMDRLVKDLAQAYTPTQVPTAMYHACTVYGQKISFSHDVIIDDRDREKCQQATHRFAQIWKYGEGHADYGHYCLELCEIKHGRDAIRCDAYKHIGLGP